MWVVGVRVLSCVERGLCGGFGENTLHAVDARATDISTPFAFLTLNLKNATAGTGPAPLPITFTHLTPADRH